MHGVGYYSISQAGLGQVAILLPPVSFQQELVRNISESFTCEKQSKLLLGIAKRGVELAIEQDEQRAETWMQAQIQAFGIEMNQEG